MNKTQIEWAQNPDGSQGYTLNSKTGCRNHTPEGLCLGGMFPCYAYRLANGRLKKRYLANSNVADITKRLRDANSPLWDRVATDPFYPRFWPKRLNEPKHLGKGQFGLATIPRGIFLDDMSDWMGDYWPREWTEMEIETMRQCPQHRFYTLTKQPQNLIKWSPFPPNVYLGVTATNQEMFDKAIYYLKMVDAKVKFLSVEPLLGRIKLDICFSTGYNTEYEREIRRNYSSQDGENGGVGDRQRGEGVEAESSEVGQVERGEQDTKLRETQGRERHGQVSSSENDDKGETLLRTGSSASMVPLQRKDSHRNDNQSQRRECKRQSSGQYGANDIQPKYEALHRSPREDLQKGQSWPFSWLIIGACTGTLNDLKPMLLKYPNLKLMPYGKRWSLQPKIEWVAEIVKAADKAGIPVFLKDNLKPLFSQKLSKEMSLLDWGVTFTKMGNNFLWDADELRQEIPK